MKGGRALGILGVAAAFLLFGAGARAAHGPVTDILLNQNVHLPSAQVCPPLGNALTELADRATKEGYPIKVAVIGSDAELGRVPELFGRPQEYARLLGREIGVYRPGEAGVQTRESLLVVMPAGFGFVRSGKAANVSLVILGLEAPEGEHPNELTKAAIGAVGELAEAAGRPVPVPDISNGCSENGGSSAAVYVVPIALALLAAAVAGVVIRRRARRGGA
jgi:hypothetical protein